MDKSSEETIISRWWEAEARVVLSSSMKTKEIGLIYSYIPFQDPNMPCRLLATQENCTLKNILMSLGDTRKVKNENKEGEMYQTDKEIQSLPLAEEVVRRFLDARHTSATPNWVWYWKWEEPNDRTMAEVVNFGVSSVFCTVTFSDWIRIALGYEAESFSRLIIWMIATRDTCRQCLKEKPHLRLHYDRLEKELRLLHPWAHWLVITSLYPSDGLPVLAGSVILRNESAELLNALTFLTNPIRALFARKDQGLIEMLPDLAVLDSRFQHDMVKETDWTRPLSTDFSFRKGLGQTDIAAFATSITEEDNVHFDRLCGVDFQTLATGGLYPIDERLLKLSDDVRACATADADLHGPIVEVIMHLLSSQNFASATAALAALRSVGIRPKQLPKYWELIEPIGNHQSYRLEYLTGPGLPCPTPHVRELKHTQQPREVLAEILRFKSYPASRGKRSSLRIETATDQVILKFETSNILCLVCRQRWSEYLGLRLKCAECYRRERICGRSTVVEAKVRKHAYEAVDEKEYPAKRIQAIPANSKDVISSRSQMVDGIALAAHSSSSSVDPYGLRLDLATLAQFTIPPTPPRTPLQQRASSLPHLVEFDKGVSRLGTGWTTPFDQSQGSEWTPPLLPLANIETYYRPFTGESVEDGGNLGRPSLPPPPTRALATSDPSLGAMFAEAARAAGRRFYPPAEVETITTVVPLGTNPATAAPSAELRNNWLPKPLVSRRDRQFGNRAVWWQVFPPLAPQLATTMTNTTAPDGETLQPGVVHCERPEAALGHSIKQSQCVEHSNRWPPNTQMASGFTPVNPPLSASLLRPVATAQHHSPTKPRFTTFTGSDPAHGGYQQDSRTTGGLQGPAKPPNPFSGRHHRAWPCPDPLPYYHHHTLNAAMAGHASPAQQPGEGQAVEGHSPSLTVGKGKGKLVKVPPQAMEVHGPSRFDEASFEESIRSCAKVAMEGVNIHHFLGA